MNYTKAQKEIFDALCKGARLGRFALDEDHTFITPNGYMGYVFPNAIINFNLEKIPEIAALPIREIISEENELRMTLDLRLDQHRGSMFRRLRGKDKNVLVNVKFLSCFQNPSFYQAASPHSIITVTEKIRLGGHGSQSFFDCVVGIILPVRNDSLQGDYYDWADSIKAVATCQ